MFSNFLRSKKFFQFTFFGSLKNFFRGAIYIPKFIKLDSKYLHNLVATHNPTEPNLKGLILRILHLNLNHNHQDLQ